ncbi:hypothetical protein X975_10870, partial [Stegodyphus mimosarum]
MSGRGKKLNLNENLVLNPVFQTVMLQFSLSSSPGLLGMYTTHFHQKNSSFKSRAVAITTVSSYRKSD